MLPSHPIERIAGLLSAASSVPDYGLRAVYLGTARAALLELRGSVARVAADPEAMEKELARAAPFAFRTEST